MRWFYPVAVAILLLGGGSVAYKLTRGLRNKNPGNLKTNPLANTWRGEIGADGPFVVFNTFMNGFRALAIVILRYPSKHNVKNLYELGHIYAPPGDNKGADNYGKNLSRQLGVSEKDALYAGYGIKGLIKAIVVNENGRIAASLIPYTDEDINSGIQWASDYTGIKVV